MANYSDIFPISGGSTSLAGLTWEEKTEDFTAQANYGYYIDTALDHVAMTLPASPPDGTEVWFWSIGTNQVRFTTTDNIKNALLATDTVKKTVINDLIIKLTYTNSTIGWDWDAGYNSYISDQYVGAATYYPYAASPTPVNGLMTRDSNNADIFWNLGTVNLTEAWQHPATSRGLVTVTQSGVRDNNANPIYWGHNIIDNNASVSDINSSWYNKFSAEPNGHWVQIDFINKQVSVEKYWIYENSTSNYNGIDLFGSNDGINFDLIDAPTISVNPFLSPTLTPSPYYRYIRLWDKATHAKVVQITEFCLWGYLQ